MAKSAVRVIDLFPDFTPRRFVLFFDVIDGVVARMRGVTSDSGYITDVSLDRVSEAIIFYSLSRICIILVILNTALTLYSYKFEKHIILPIRQGLFILLLIKVTF